MLINRTHFSVRQAFSKPDDLVKRAKEIGLNYCGICDINTLAGVVEFVEACDKYDIMAIIGVTVGDRHIFARNYNGWKQLILLVSGVSDDISDCWVYDLPFIESRYVNESDEKLYRIIRAMDNKTTVHNLQEDTSNKFLIATNQDVSMFTKYSIFRQPLLPKFTDDEIGVLRKIVFENFDRLTPKDSKEQYLDRIQKELKVIELNNLAGYFLIVYDFCKYARSIGALVGPGRGSVGGSLVAYMTKQITLVDPIPHGLLFSRFFNAARSYPKHLSFNECPFVDVWRDVGI